MRQQVVGFCELYMLMMGSWSVMGGSTLMQGKTIHVAHTTLVWIVNVGSIEMKSHKLVGLFCVRYVCSMWSMFFTRCLYLHDILQGL